MYLATNRAKVMHAYSNAGVTIIATMQQKQSHSSVKVHITEGLSQSEKKTMAN